MARSSERLAEKSRAGEAVAQFPRPGAKLAHIFQGAPLAHGREAFRRLQRAYENGGGTAFRLADEIHAPMDAIRTVDVNEARRTEHDGVAFRLSAIAVRRGVGVMVCL